MKQRGTMAVREMSLMRAQVCKHCVERRLAESCLEFQQFGDGKRRRCSDSKKSFFLEDF